MTATGATPQEPSSASVDDENPWPGLASYQETDSRFFQGRERQIEALNELVHRERLTVLFGMAGLGKTSLLRAGLFPKLRERDELPVLVRLRFDPAAGTLRHQVFEAISRAAEEAGIEAPPCSESETLWEFFHRVETNFWSPRNRLTTPVLVVDQFEEIFTVGRHREGTEGFLEELSNLVEGRPSAALKAQLDAVPTEARRFDFGHHRYRVLLSLREDFLAELEGLRARMPSSAHNRMWLRPMDGEAALLVVDQTKGRLISTEIARAVVQVAAGKGSGDAGVALATLQIEPPILSLLCRELNNRRRATGQSHITRELLEQSQGEILETFYEQCMAQVTPQLRTFVEDELLTKAGFRDTRALADALQEPGITETDVRRLVDARLLRFEDRAGTRRLELTHDVLSKVVQASRDRRRQQEQALAERQRLEAQLQAAEKAAARRRTVAAVLLGVLVVVGSLAGLAVRESWRADEQRAIAERARVEAEHQRDEAQRALERSLFGEATTRIRLGRSAEALAYLARAIRDVPTQSRARNLAAAELLYRHWSLPVGERIQHDGPISSAVFSADGSRLVTASQDGTARLWETSTGRPLGKPLVHKSAVKVADISFDGTLVVTASDDGARVWNANTGALVAEPVADASVLAAAFSPDGRWFVITRQGGTAQLWDAKTFEAVGKPMTHEKEILSVAFDPAGKRLITTSLDGWARFWNVPAGTPAGQPLRHDGPIRVATFSNDGVLVATASADHTARVWDVGTGRPIGQPMQHNDAVLMVAFSRDGSRVVTASEDGNARVWDARSGRAIADSKPMQHAGAIVAASFSPDGTRVLTASLDSTARLWDAETGDPVSEPILHHGAVNSATFSPDGTLFLTASEDRTARVWVTRTGSAEAQPLGHDATVQSVAFSPDGRSVVTAAGRAARIWKVGAIVPNGEPMRHEDSIYQALFSPDGQRIATASRDGTARLWDANSGASIGSPMTHSGPVHRVAFSPDGERLATASDDGTAHLWNGHTAAPLAEPLRHAGSVGFVAFSPDGSRLVSASDDHSARLWRADSGVPIGAPMTADRRIMSALFSPDGKRVVTASGDGTARLWDATSGKAVGATMWHGTSRVLWAEFNRDGSRVVTAAEDRTARLWDGISGGAVGEWMVHDKEVVIAHFSPDGERVVTADIGGDVRIWDARSGTAMSAPLRHCSWVSEAAFAPDSSRLATVADSTVRIWDMPAIPAADGPALATLAELVAGYALDDLGVLSPEATSTRRLEELGKTLSTRSQLQLAQIVEWLLADPETRVTSPFSAVVAGCTTPAWKRRCASCTRGSTQ